VHVNAWFHAVDALDLAFTPSTSESLELEAGSWADVEDHAAALFSNDVIQSW